eukprot:CAMPEP_0197031712 /NCGR_PEP_ID=MMETSP1384-20130603/10630_1 /TAXON_ID=29189 /ORGANISM="Ammonia sp." /LENGTH=257 /DNA_ID=CAMNT_0042461279 /DNA_START=32 /DNA_END=805 /DNA_ORIENTATION=+
MGICQVNKQSIILLVALVMISPSMRIVVDYTTLISSQPTTDSAYSTESDAVLLAELLLPRNFVYSLGALGIFIVYCHGFAQINGHRSANAAHILLNAIAFSSNLAWSIADMVELYCNESISPNLYNLAHLAKFPAAGLYQLLHSILVIQLNGIQRKGGKNRSCWSSLFQCKICYLTLIMLITNLNVIIYTLNWYLFQVDDKWIGLLASTGINCYFYAFIGLFLTEFKCAQFSIVPAAEEDDEESDEVDTEMEMSRLQ